MLEGLPTDWVKRSPQDYYDSAVGLFNSMQDRGFLDHYAIPLDRNRDLLGGAHRVACAMALDILEIPCTVTGGEVFAPPWDREWFIDKGMAADDFFRLESDFSR